MGTDYVFICDKCKKHGGGFSRQAWGSGNANIIDTFRFLMKHNSLCGGDFSIIDSQDRWDIEGSIFDDDDDLLGYFPHSEEWKPEVNQAEYQKYLDYCNKSD